MSSVPADLSAKLNKIFEQISSDGFLGETGAAQHKAPLPALRGTRSGAPGAPLDEDKLRETTDSPPPAAVDVTAISLVHNPSLSSSTQQQQRRAPTPLQRGNVEELQTFRIRKSANGHRLPPLQSSSFDVRLQQSQRSLPHAASPDPTSLSPAPSNIRGTANEAHTASAVLSRRGLVDFSTSTIKHAKSLEPSLRSAAAVDNSVSYMQSQMVRQCTHNHHGASSLLVHKKLCRLCDEMEQVSFRKRVESLCNKEATLRQAIELSALHSREAELKEAWLRIRTLRETLKRSQRDELEALQRVTRISQTIEERLMTQFIKVVCKDLTLEWEIGFDDIAALERLSYRHLQQIRDVRDRKEVRQHQEEEQERQLQVQRADERQLNRLQIAQGRLFDEENFERNHLDKGESAVRGALELVFRESRRKLLDAEAHVHAILTRHAQKLQAIENEKERMKVEEISKRELFVATEKRAWETMQQMEPDSRRRSTQQTNARLKRQAAERLAVENACHTTAQVIMEEEIADFDKWSTGFDQEMGMVTHREARRAIKEERKRWRAALESSESVRLLAEDDAAWAFVRYRFANSLVFACVEEEHRQRQLLAQQKKTERDFIWDLLRVRLFLCQQERRIRLEFLDEETKEFASIKELLKKANTLNAFFWFESIERRNVRDEYEQDVMRSMSAYHSELNTAARLLVQNPKVRTDKVTLTGGSEYGFWVRNSTLTWYWLSDEVSLFDGSTLRYAASTNGVVTEVKNCTITVEIMNPDDGDRLIYEEPNNPNDPLPLIKKKEISATYSGPVRELYNAFRYVNVNQYSKFRLFPRLLKVSFGGVTFFLLVVLVAPLCPLPSVCVSSRIVFPLTLLNVPSYQEYKTGRVVLSLNEKNAQHNSGHKLSLQLPPEFTLHAKNGVMHQGKILMRPKSVSDKSIEFEFDPKPNSQMKPFLQCIVLQHGDDSTQLLPLNLDVFLTKKSDGSTMKITQKLDIDSERSTSPLLRVPGSELYYRLAFAPTSERLDPFLPPNPQHVFSNCSVMFPPDQPDIRGGMMKFTLTGHDTLTNLGLHSRGHFIVDREHQNLYFRAPAGFAEASSASRQASTLSSSSTDAPPSIPRSRRRGTVVAIDSSELAKDGYALIGNVMGIDSTTLLIQFRGDLSMTPFIVNDVLRAVTVSSNRTTLPKRGELSMSLSLHVDLGLTSDPIDTIFKLNISGPVLECAAKNGGFPYREGAGPKAFPSIVMKPQAALTPCLSPDAMMTVSIVDGLEEESDEIDVADCEVRDGRLIHVQNGQPIAEVRRISGSSIQLILAGQFAGSLPLREDIADPYTLHCSSFAVANKYDVNVQHVNVLLRSLRFNCNSVDPQEDQKVVLITFDDGKTGRSSVALDLAIETVDDPTDIIIDEPVVEYRQYSKKAIQGCPILATVRLEDIDSDNFHGGYIVVEHVSGPAEVGDHLYLMTPKQQELLLYRSRGKSSVNHLQVLMSTVSDPSMCMALATVVDEQPQQLLSLRENRYMMFNGESIGQISTKQAGNRDERVTYSIRLSFASDSKFISFPAAEYCLKCFAFENKSAKMNTCERQYEITLNCTGLKSTCDTVERVTVSGFVALLANPSFASNVRFEEGGKPKPLLKQATTALQQPLFQRGFLRATIVNPYDGDEIQIDAASPDFKVKDGRTVVAGKENVANIPARKSPSGIHIDFLKITNATLQALVRALVYNTVSRSIDPTQRTVEIECSSGTDVDLCCVTILIDIQRRDEAVEFTTLPGALPLIYMSGQPPWSLCSGLGVTMRRNLTATTEIEVQLPEKPKLGEHLALTATVDLDVVEDDETQRLHFIYNRKLLAYAPKPKEKEEDSFLFGKSLTITLVAEANAEDNKRILDTIRYTNTCRGDRGMKKNISLAVKQRSSVIAKTILAVEIIAPVLDFSHCNSIVNSQGTSLVASACRLQLASKLAFAEITVVAATGYDFSDSLVFRFPPNDPFGFVIEDDWISVTNPQVVQTLMTRAVASPMTNNSEEPASPMVAPPSPTLQRSSSRRSISMSPSQAVRDGKSVQIASVQINTTSISIVAEGALSNSVLQALLRSIAISGEPRGNKDILVEVAVTVACGQCRELVRVLM